MTKHARNRKPAPKVDFIIDNNIPNRIRKTKWTPIIDASMKLKKRQSILLPNGYNGKNSDQMATLVRAALNRHVKGKMVIHRTDEGVRIWRA